MYHRPVSPIVLATALGACALQPELLNSERIEQRFGSYGISVLEQDGAVRRSSLYSLEDGVPVCRSYAVVRFVEPVHAEVETAHRMVLDGASIGTTFDAQGWTIRKQTIFIGSVRVPGPGHEIAKLMHLDSAATLAMHAYELSLAQGPHAIRYATVVESHHPGYLTEADLVALYGRDGAGDAGAAEVAFLKGLVLD